MAPVLDPEIQFAQRLACNEKPIRTKAIKKLRKYIAVRSQTVKGGFGGDDLLKLWKGLFYCLWMQDKPLIQEELSTQIATLLHNFQSVDSQFSYLEGFLHTMKREWNGIDRLRMDKVFQLVRFVFRQGFEMLKRKNWDTSLIARFLELLTAQIFQSSSNAPPGLQFHILDLYMTELAAVGSAELTADQNLTFIEPFCTTAATTKDRLLLKSICSSIFSAIVDQAPFAVEDLLREMKAREGDESDSGQASDEEEEEEKEVHKSKSSSKKLKKMTPSKKMSKAVSDGDNDDDDFDDFDDDEDDDEDDELPGDSEIGPVLQFDYSALADKLFGLASQSSTPSYNRQRLYRIVKTLRDLSEGIFPQDEYPEEVSTDEDDDEMFGSRKRLKRGRGFGEEDEAEEGPASKKKKGKKKDSTQKKSSKDSEKDDETAESMNEANKKKKKKKKRNKKKKAVDGPSAAIEGETQSEDATTQATGVEATVEMDSEKSPAEDTENVTEPAEDTADQSTQGDSATTGLEGEKVESSSENVTEVVPMEAEVELQTPQPTGEAEKNQQPSVDIPEEPSQPEPELSEDLKKDQPEKSSTKKKKKRKKSEVITEPSEPIVEVAEAGEEQLIPATQEGDAVVEVTEQETTPENDTTTTTSTKKKSKKKSLKQKKTPEDVGDEAGISVDLTVEPEPAKEPENQDAGPEEPALATPETDAEVAPTEPKTTGDIDTTTTPGKKKSMKKNLKEKKKKAEVVEVDLKGEVEGKTMEVDVVCETSTEIDVPTQNNGKCVDLTQEEEAVTTTVDLTEEAAPAGEPAADCEEHAADLREGDAVVAVEPETTPVTDATTTTTVKKSKRKSLKAEKKLEQVEDVAQVQVVEGSMESEVTSTSCEASSESTETTQVKTKKKKKKAEQQVDLTKEEEEVTTTIDLTLEASDESPEQPTLVAGDTAIAVGQAEQESSAETDNATPSTKKRRKQKKQKAAEIEEAADVVEVDVTSTDCDPLNENTASLKKKKVKQSKEATQEEEIKTIEDLSIESTPCKEPAADDASAPLSKKKNKKSKKVVQTEEPIETPVDETVQEADPDELISDVSMVTPGKKKKNKRKAAVVQEPAVEGQVQLDETGVAADDDTAEDIGPESAALASSEKKAKKKRKIPITFEYEADELSAAAEEAAMNGLAVRKTPAKKTKLTSDAAEPTTPLSTKKMKKNKLKAGQTSDFITFQSSGSIPTPLFCKKAKKVFTPKSDSKKVTFGLKNNKTAEFRKTDQSHLVSPVGSSRVAFDPKQKPKFGVLKSPATPLSGSKKKSSKATKSPKTPVSTPKGRPTAADFF